MGMRSSAKYLLAEMNRKLSDQIQMLSYAAVAANHGSRKGYAPFSGGRYWARSLETLVNNSEKPLWLWYDHSSWDLKSKLLKLGMLLLSESFNFSTSIGGDCAVHESDCVVL